MRDGGTQPCRLLALTKLLRRIFEPPFPLNTCLNFDRWAPGRPCSRLRFVNWSIPIHRTFAVELSRSRSLFPVKRGVASLLGFQMFLRQGSRGTPRAGAIYTSDFVENYNHKIFITLEPLSGWVQWAKNCRILLLGLETIFGTPSFNYDGLWFSPANKYWHTSSS